MEEESKERRERETVDAELVRKTLMGDNDAFTELVEAYYRMFYGLALGFVHDIGQAEDIVQDGLITIHKSLDSLRDPERFGSWAYTIIRRKSIRAVTEMKSEAEHITAYSEKEETKKIQEQMKEMPEEALSFDAKKETIMRGIAQLSEHYREVIVLYYFEHMDIPRIAKRLRSSQGAIDVRLHRARRKLQEVLQGYIL